MIIHIMLDSDVVTTTERRVLHENEAKNINGGPTRILEQKYINSNLNTLMIFIRWHKNLLNDKTVEIIQQQQTPSIFPCLCSM